MKFILLFIISTFINLSAFAYDGTLILNFDINQTLMGPDPAGGKDLETCVTSIVAKRKKYAGSWEEGQSKPTPYYDYLKVKYPDNKEFRNEKLAQFVKQSDSKAVKTEYENIKRKITSQETEVFPSFFNMVSYLERNHINYHIVLRTFGTDLKNVSETVSTQLGVHFEFAKFQGETLVLDSGKVLTEKQEIADYIASTQFLAIQDEYKPWNTAKEHWSKGKVFFFNKTSRNQKILPLFFDDNVEAPPSQNNVVRPIDATTGNTVYPGELYGKQIFKVNTRKAIMDEDYFIKLIQKALAKH